jgi:hypothetical protein
MRKISALACVSRRYEFNDGSVVLWRPVDDSNKAHGIFRVDIAVKMADGGVRVTWEERQGPPSESASLHWLKWAIKNMNKESA